MKMMKKKKNTPRVLLWHLTRAPILLAG